MKRFGLSLSVLVLAATSVRAGDDGVKQSIAYVQKLQTESGGFRAQESQMAPSLRATSAAVRALKYFGGDIPNKDKCIKFVESCHDAERGGFADTPKGKPDVFSTAVGMMVVAELKMSTDKYVKGAVKYLNENAKSFEEIRIAAAGLESLGLKTEKKEAWLAEIAKLRNPDGSFGKDIGKPRATAGAVVTILRLGGKVDDTDKVRKILFPGQRPGGGFAKDDGSIDLENAYRIMRCYHMIKDYPPSVVALRQYVNSCRNKDGGYGAAPRQPSSVNGTYFAAIILHWLKE